jgi:ABC-2 type transport system permease protein
MTGYGVFVGKEIKEFFMTSKWIVMVCVMAVCAVLAPLLTVIFPPLLGMAGESEASIKSAMGPDWLFTLNVYRENITQFAVIMLIFMFGSCIAGEKHRGTATIILAKNISRPAFLLSKLTVQLILWTVFYAIATVNVFVSSELMFGNEGTNYFTAFFVIWLFGVFMICLTVFFSSLMKRAVSASMLALAVWFLLSILAIIPYIDVYTPGYVNFIFRDLLFGVSNFSDVLRMVIVMVLSSIVLIAGSIWLINKKEV